MCLQAPAELSRLTQGHNVDTQNIHENVIPLFLSCFSFNHQYEFYFPVHPNMEGDYTISITAQLGAGATAAKWKVDMFDFQGIKTWVSVGDLTGGELRSRGISAIYFRTSLSCPLKSGQVDNLARQLFCVTRDPEKK